MRHLLVDCVAGLILSAVLFFAAPLFAHGGNWGLADIGIFPAILVYFFIFLVYSRTPLYRKLHAAGTRAFSAALAAYAAGAAAGYSAILFTAAFSVTQWSPAL